MHRYRDAILYGMSHAGDKKDVPGPYDRTMFGAYVLFPYSNEEKYKEHDFYRSIGTVNIGGLPFLSAATIMVREFLEELISDTGESAFEKATLPRDIEEKLARVDWAKRDVLIVNMPGEAVMTAWPDEHSCVVRGDEISEEHLPIHYVALYKPGVGIERFGTVLFSQTDEADNYGFKVDKWRQLP